MNKTEFMRQLETLLQNISEQERQEALQYYGGYFDDAGPENEQAVLEALGNPARVAENIRRDLYGAGYGDGYEARRPVTGRELTEYGTVIEETQNPGTSQRGAEERNGGGRGGFVQDMAPGAGASNATGWGTTAQGNSVPGGSARAAAATMAPPWQSVPQPAPTWGNGGQGAQGNSGKSEKKPLSGGMIALIVILCIFGLPVIGGLIGGAVGLAGGLLAALAGVAVAWFGTILGFGIAALICILAGLFVSVVGVIGLGIHPLASVGFIGCGLIVIGMGIFFLMLTVAMAGVATPALFRGLGRLFKNKKKTAQQ